MSAIETVFNGLSEKNKRVFIAGGIAASTFFLVWVGVAQPAIRKTQSIEIQKKELQEKEPVLRDVLALEARLAAYQVHLSPDRDLSPLMGDLSDLAEKAGLQSVSTALEKSYATQEGEIEKLSIAIDGMGTFHQLGDYVSRIESLNRYTKVSKVEFGKTTSSTAMSVSSKPASPDAKRIALVVSTFYSPQGITSV